MTVKADYTVLYIFCAHKGKCALRLCSYWSNVIILVKKNWGNTGLDKWLHNSLHSNTHVKTHTLIGPILGDLCTDWPGACQYVSAHYCWHEWTWESGEPGRGGPADWCLPTSLCLHSLHSALWLWLLLGQSQGHSRSVKGAINRSEGCLDFGI